MSPQQRLDHPNRTILSHYRPDVDGLRAIAVLAVIGFHAFPDWVRGGFVGVDVFFVISGYLISTILFTSMDHNSFSFWRFYARRIRRIFPALLVVLLACLLLGWLVLFSNEYTHLAKHIAGGAAFVSNFVLWNEAGYFDTSAETKPLLHLWSLGIEEQFYILWPLLLYCTWKCTGGWFALLAVVLVGTFVFNIRTVVIDSTAAFYSPLARFWELMAGGMLAYFSLKGTDPHWVSAKRLATVFRAASTARSNNIKGIVGLVLLATALLMLDRTVQYPGWWALLPIVGTCMVLCAGSAAWINKKLLATRVLVVIGLISYPLYLWHWPLLSFARIVEGETPPPRTRALAVFASFLLASLTYLLVERPIRFGKISAAKTSMPLIILMGAVGCAGLYVYKEYGLPFRHKGLEDIVAAATDFDQKNYASLTKYGEGIDELEQSILVIGKPGAATTALVGDSTMQQYIPRVRRLAERNAIDLDNNRVVFAIAGGLPVPDIWSDFDPVQAAAWTKILPALSGNAVKTVAIAAYWTAFFKFAGFYVRSIGPDKLL
jgi:peptidoglycan/LPS O-acetylase OafA/YrhL